MGRTLEGMPPLPAHLPYTGVFRAPPAPGTLTDNTLPLLGTVTQQEKTPPPRPHLLEAGVDGCEEPKQHMSWEQEFLVGNSPGGSGRALCMVCGAEIRFPSADTARTHILEQHPHTLDLSPSEKNNILEAWSEGVALLQDVQVEQPSLPSPGREGGGRGKNRAHGSYGSSVGFCPLRIRPGCRARPRLQPRPCQDASGDCGPPGLRGQPIPP